jgi:hypothetical protein
MSTGETAAAESHLASCAACRQELARLQHVLGAVDSSVLAAVEPPDGFERTVWARLEPNLRGQARVRFSWWRLAPAPMALTAAVLVLVGAAFFAGRMFPGGGVRVPDDPGMVSTEALRERILLVDLGEHLDRSQMVLVELVSAGAAEDVDISAERARAEQLVADNRIYRRAAVETGERAVLDLLDELERVLVDVAASPAHLTGNEFDEVRRRIESRGLLFKVRVVSSEVRERQREAILNAGI